MRITFKGFVPDADPSADGVLTDVTNMIPTFKGMKCAPEPNAVSDALSEDANSLAAVTLLDGTRRTFAGTNSTIQEAISGSWTDRSAVGGYSIGPASRWSFDQFGDVTIAAAKAETLQASTGSGVDFAAIAGAPKAAHVAVSNGFAMIVNTNEATYGDQEDRWWCSAYLDYTDWTPAISTQCTTGRLVDTPGPIRAIKSFGSGFIIYKDRAVFVGRYVGPPVVWQWDKLPGDIGTFSNDCVVNLGSAHAFVGYDDLYLFDGSRPVSIGEGIREWFYDSFDSSKGYRTIAVYDVNEGNVWWWYCSRSNNTNVPDRAVIYNIRSGRWGGVQQSVQASAQYFGSGITYDGLGTEYTTYDNLPTDISYDSAYWVVDNPELAIITTDKKLDQMTGESVSARFVMQYLGDNQFYSTISRLRLKYSQSPTTFWRVSWSGASNMGDSFLPGSGYPVTASEGRCDFIESARWHKLTVEIFGDAEVIGANVDIQPDGEE